MNETLKASVCIHHYSSDKPMMIRESDDEVLDLCLKTVPLRMIEGRLKLLPEIDSPNKLLEDDILLGVMVLDYNYIIEMDTITREKPENLCDLPDKYEHCYALAEYYHESDNLIDPYPEVNMNYSDYIKNLLLHERYEDVALIHKTFKSILDECIEYKKNN